MSNDVSPRGQRELAAGEKHPTTSTRGRHRFHSFSNAESIYARDTSLSREMRHRTNTEKRNLQRDRTLPELHVSRTMIRGNTNKADGAISQSMTRLHGIQFNLIFIFPSIIIINHRILIYISTHL